MRFPYFTRFCAALHGGYAVQEYACWIGCARFSNRLSKGSFIPGGSITGESWEILTALE